MFWAHGGLTTQTLTENISPLDAAKVQVLESVNATITLGPYGGSFITFLVAAFAIIILRTMSPTSAQSRGDSSVSKDIITIKSKEQFILLSI